MSVVFVAILAFVLGFVGSVPLAGPIAVLVISRAGIGKFEEARSIAFGAAIAEGLYAGVAFWGFATFLATHAAAMPIAHGVTAVVLLAVGAHFMRWKAPTGDEKVEQKARSAFFVGLTAALANPTLLLTWSAVTTAIYSRQIVVMTGFEAIPFGLAAMAGIATWFVILVALMKRYHHKLPRTALQWIVRGMGLLLVGIAVVSAIDLVRKLRS